MNYAINLTKLQSQANKPNSSGLTLAAYISLQRLNRTKYQLEQIINDHPVKVIRKQAKVYLQKNTKLIAIANELIDRLKRYATSTNLKEGDPKSTKYLSQIKSEMDILDDMHFNVAKSYSAFIYQNYETVVIPINEQRAGNTMTD
jgi:hypothetical protein